MVRTFETEIKEEIDRVTDTINRRVAMDQKIRELWGEQNRWINDGANLKGKCIDEIKNKITKLMRETDYREGAYYTCGCGIEIHPQRLINLRAIHCKDCKYGNLIKCELKKCGQPTSPPGGWLNAGSLLGKRVKRRLGDD